MPMRNPNHPGDLIRDCLDDYLAGIFSAPLPSLIVHIHGAAFSQLARYAGSPAGGKS